MSINYSDLWLILTGEPCPSHASPPTDHICTNTLSFVLSADNDALRQELDSAISELKAGGVWDALAAACRNSGPVSTGESKQGPRPRRLRAIITGALPPFDTQTISGDPAGLYVQAAQLAAHTLNAEVQLLPMQPNDVLNALLNGAADFALWAAGSGLRSGEVIHQRSIPEGLAVTDAFYSEAWYAESALDKQLSLDSFDGVWSEILISGERRLLNAGVDHYITIKDGAFARYTEEGQLIERRRLAFQDGILTGTDSLNNKTVSRVEPVDGMGGFKLTCVEGPQEGCVSFLVRGPTTPTW